MKTLSVLKKRKRRPFFGSVFLLLERKETAKMEWSACLDEYEKLVIRMTTPRLVSFKIFISLVLPSFDFFFIKSFSWVYLLFLPSLFEFHCFSCQLFL